VLIELCKRVILHDCLINDLAFFVYFTLCKFLLVDRLKVAFSFLTILFCLLLGQCVHDLVVNIHDVNIVIVFIVFLFVFCWLVHLDVFSRFRVSVLVLISFTHSLSRFLI